MRNVFKCGLAAAVMAAASVAGCGGGGGSGGGATTYAVGGAASGLTGTLTLQNNGADTVSLAASGSFGFATGIAGGGAYSVSVLAAPAGQTCVVSNGAGTVASANVTNVVVSCSTVPAGSHTIGGTVSGLAGSVVLQNGGTDDLTLSASGSFTFATPLVAGSAYAVTVLSQPSGQTCTVANGSGTVAGSNIANVAVTCATQVSALRIGAGAGYTLAVRADGSVLSWGTGMQGGSGMAVPGTAASAIAGLGGIASVVATPQVLGPSLAISSSGAVLGWGFGILGDFVTGTYGSTTVTPIAIDLFGTVKQVSVCPGQSLPIAYALHGDGSVSYVPATSAVGANAVRTITAATVVGLGSVVAMSSYCASDTLYQMTVVKSDGTVWNLTPSFSGATITMAVAQVSGLPPVASVSCGTGLRRFCLARTTAGEVWAWGDNTFGQLGDGTTTGRSIPVQVPGLSSIRQVAAGTVASYAVSASGAVYSWGGGSGNDLYLGRTVNGDALVPKQITLRAAATGLATSSLHAVVQLTDGSVWGWGSNAAGELGDGTTGNSAAAPVQALGVNLN